MSDGQQTRQIEGAQQFPGLGDEPVAEHLGELSAPAREHLNEAAEMLARLRSEDAHKWLTDARQRTGQ